MKAQIYLLAFIEGSLVIALELLSVKLVTPFFGNSIYIISSILGITLASLLIGYYLGGIIVNKNYQFVTAAKFVIFSCIYFLLASTYSDFILGYLVSTGLIIGSLLSLIYLISIPLILLGMVSPILIQLLSDIEYTAGKASSLVFTVSTFGGIFSTFGIGLVLIPTLGITKSIYLFNSIGIGISLGLLSYNGKFKRSAKLIVFLIPVMILLWVKSHTSVSEPGKQIIYETDGMMGNLKVVDLKPNFRAMLSNDVFQTMIERNEKKSMLPYTHVMATTASLVPKEKRLNAALIGLAGGSLIRELSFLNFQNIDVIDIDKRTDFITRTFFDIPETLFNFYENDGRNFMIRSVDEKYNLIIIDVSVAEEQPYHLYTHEAFKLYYKKLSADGLIILNILDYDNLDEAEVLARVGDSMLFAGFETRLIKDFNKHIRSATKIDQIDIHEKILVGIKGNPDLSIGNIAELNSCCSLFPFNRSLKMDFGNKSFPKNTQTLGRFTDEKPEMDYMNFKRITDIRKLQNKAR